MLDISVQKYWGKETINLSIFNSEADIGTKLYKNRWIEVHDTIRLRLLIIIELVGDKSGDDEDNEHDNKGDNGDIRFAEV